MRKERCEDVETLVRQAIVQQSVGKLESAVRSRAYSKRDWEHALVQAVTWHKRHDEASALVTELLLHETEAQGYVL
jgi:hypothetical protein